MIERVSPPQPFDLLLPDLLPPCVVLLIYATPLCSAVRSASARSVAVGSVAFGLATARFAATVCRAVVPPTLTPKVPSPWTEGVLHFKTMCLSSCSSAFH